MWLSLVCVIERQRAHTIQVLLFIDFQERMKMLVQGIDRRKEKGEGESGLTITIFLFLIRRKN